MTVPEPGTGGRSVSDRLRWLPSGSRLVPVRLRRAARSDPAGPPGALPPPPPPGVAATPATRSHATAPTGTAGLGYGASIVGLWPLVLSKGARTLTMVFIVLGALLYGGCRSSISASEA